MLKCELDVMEYAITMETLALECDEPVEDDFDEEPYFDECGFNPYMGCYDFDCQSVIKNKEKHNFLLTLQPILAIMQIQKGDK